jgi:hypothetical protein
LGGLDFEWNVILTILVSAAFVSQGAANHSTTNSTVPQIFYVGHASEALCILVELASMFLFIMGWYS